MRVLARIETGPVERVGGHTYRDRILVVPRHERRGLLLIDLCVHHGTECIGRFAHRDSALIAAGVSAALVERPAGFRFIDTGTRIVRQHGVALVGTDAIRDGREQCLVVVASERGGQFSLDKRALAAALAPGADLARQRRLIAACSHS